MRQNGASTGLAWPFQAHWVGFYSLVVTTLLPAGLLDNSPSRLDNSDGLALCSLMVGEFSMDSGLGVKPSEGEWCPFIEKEPEVIGWCALLFDALGLEADWCKGKEFLFWEGLGSFQSSSTSAISSVPFFNLSDSKILNSPTSRPWLSPGLWGSSSFTAENLTCFNGSREFEEESSSKQCSFSEILSWMVRPGDTILLLGSKFWWKRTVSESVLLELELRFRIPLGAPLALRESVLCRGKDWLSSCFNSCGLGSIFLAFGIGGLTWDPFSGPGNLGFSFSKFWLEVSGTDDFSFDSDNSPVN